MAFASVQAADTDNLASDDPARWLTMDTHSAACLAEDNWEQIHGDVQRFLDTWSFSLSASGQVCARPRGQTLTIEQLDDLFRRMLFVIDARFPRIVILDLTDVSAPTSDWSRVEDALRAFAAQIGADLSGGPRPGHTARCYFLIRASVGRRGA